MSQPIRISRGAVAPHIAASQSLRACPACHAQVSVRAVSCPHCAEPFQAAGRVVAGAINMRDPVHVLGIVVCVVIGLCVLGAAVYALTV